MKSGKKIHETLPVKNFSDSENNIRKSESKRDIAILMHRADTLKKGSHSKN
jgi:hypothetical protein